MSQLQDLPRPALTADVAAVAGPPGEERVLLILRANDPFAGRWALPGGFVDLEERVDAAARRELTEETGLEAQELELLGVYDKPGRDPRGWVVSGVFIARLDAPRPVEGGDDAADARWFSLGGLPKLAFDHAEVLEDVRRRLEQATG